MAWYVFDGQWRRIKYILLFWDRWDTISGRKQYKAVCAKKPPAGEEHHEPTVRDMSCMQEVFYQRG